MLAPAQTPVFFTQNCPLFRCICGRLLPTIGICNTAIAGFLTFCYFSGERFFFCSNETFVLFLGKGPPKMEKIETFTIRRWTFHK